MNIHPPARPHGMPYKGKRVFTFWVTVEQSGLDWRHRVIMRVVARSADEAVNLVRDELAGQVEHPTSVCTAGPKGGITERFIGWTTLIGSRLMNLNRNQLTLAL